MKRSKTIEVDELDALAAELQGKSYKYYRPAIEEMFWYARPVGVDPLGNRLTFTSVIYKA